MVVRRFHPHTHSPIQIHTFIRFSLFGLVISIPGEATNAMGTVNVHSSISNFVDVLPAFVVVAVLVRAVVVEEEVDVVTAAMPPWRHSQRPQ